MASGMYQAQPALSVHRSSHLLKRGLPKRESLASPGQENRKIELLRRSEDRLLEGGKTEGRTSSLPGGEGVNA